MIKPTHDPDIFIEETKKEKMIILSQLKAERDMLKAQFDANNNLIDLLKNKDIESIKQAVKDKIDIIQENNLDLLNSYNVLKEKVEEILK